MSPTPKSYEIMNDQYFYNKCAQFEESIDGLDYVRFDGICVFLNEPYSVKIKKQDLIELNNGGSFQSILHYLSKGDREFLISGISPKGWEQDIKGIEGEINARDKKQSLITYSPSMTYHDAFLCDLEFAQLYLSVYYPFNENEINVYWDYLRKGSAYYALYVQDIDIIANSDYGLCYNQNIEWTLDLKRKWPIGYWNISIGYFDGGYYDAERKQTIVFGDENPDTLFDIIPLSIEHNISQSECSLRMNPPSWLNEMMRKTDYEGDFDEYFTKEELLFPKSYERLSVKDLVELLNSDKESVLCNKSIWENTLRDIVTKEFMEQVINAVIREARPVCHSPEPPFILKPDEDLELFLGNEIDS